MIKICKGLYAWTEEDRASFFRHRTPDTNIVAVTERHVIERNGQRKVVRVLLPAIERIEDEADDAYNHFDPLELDSADDRSEFKAA